METHEEAFKWSVKVRERLDDIEDALRDFDILDKQEARANAGSIIDSFEKAMACMQKLGVEAAQLAVDNGIEWGLIMAAFIGPKRLP